MHRRDPRRELKNQKSRKRSGAKRKTKAGKEQEKIGSDGGW
jgi:hypothetical protein